MTALALSLVLLSAFLHASWNAVTKGSRSPMAFLLVLDLVGALVLLPLLLVFCRLTEIPGEAWLLIAATGLVHSLYAYWLCRAYEEGDLSLVYPVVRSTPALVPLVAVPLFGEHVSVAGLGGILLVFLGMWLIQTQGRVRWRDLWSPRRGGLAYAYLALGTTVVYSLIDKQAMTVLNQTVWTGPMPRSIAFYALMATAYLPPFAVLARRRLGRTELTELLRGEGRVLLGAAVAGFVSYTLILEAFRRTPVSYVVAVRQTSVMFAVLLGVVWLRERPGRARLSGIAATVIGVALISFS